MTVAERVGPDAVCCCNCEYWRRHYIKIEGSIKKFWPLETGHCANVERRMPRKKPNDRCERFSRKGDESNAGTEEAEA